MIIIKSNSILTASYKTFESLFMSDCYQPDSEIYKEDAACIEINEINVNEIGFQYDGKIMRYSFPFEDYLPYVSADLSQIELDHWSKVLLTNSFLKNIVHYLKKNEFSKRAIVDIWKTKYSNLNNSSVCVTYLFFRKTRNGLEMHVHSRALNALKLSLLDFQAMCSIGQYVAHKLNLKFCRYIHFIDSLHIYKTDLEIANQQYNFFINSKIWQKKLN